MKNHLCAIKCEEQGLCQHKINHFVGTIITLLRIVIKITSLTDFYLILKTVQKCDCMGDMDTRVLQILMSYEFPGNIRELENIIEHAFVLCSQGYINLHHLPNFLSLQANAGEKDDPVKAVKIKLITDALTRNGYNRNAAAKDLGTHKSTLFRRIKKLGIKL